MNWSAQAAAIRSRFAAQVATPQSLDTVYDNEADRDEHSSPWCRFSVRPGDRFYAEMPGRSRTPGVAIAAVFITVGESAATAHTLADTIAASFERVTAGGIVYHTPRVVEVGHTGKQRWYQVNVEIPFHADDT